MEFDGIFSYVFFIIYLTLFFLVYLYVKRLLSNYGFFNALSVFILTFCMFYFFVPFFQTYFKLYRDDTSLFVKILNQLNDGEVFLNFLISALCLIIIIFSYNLNFKLKKGKFYNKSDFNQNIIGKDILYKKVNIITDFIFIFSMASIVLLIAEVGSLKTYLSLGAFTRGLNKSLTDYIKSGYLQFITFSTLILVTPYLYLYLYRLKKSRFVLIKFVLSLLFSILFLFYNQGRAPLILFFLPFLFTINKRGKKGFLGLVILFLIGLSLLKYLDGVFHYLAYGYYITGDNTNLVTEFLREFSYPFANFSIRNELVNYSGHRFMYDYIIWPLTMIPNSLLKLINFNKESIISVSTLNTEAYGVFLGVNPTGGIPVDILTFNFYQLGYITLIPMCLIIGRVLKKLDLIFYFFKNDFAIKVILYRISFSMINILNNADISAIIRNRLDVVTLIIIIIYIYIKRKNSLKEEI